MKNKKGFAVLPILVVIAILAIGGGAYYYTKVSKVTPVIQDETTGWKTYTDSIYGFEIKYPAAWIQSIHGPNLVLQMDNASNESISIQALEGYKGKKFEDIYTGGAFKKIDFVKDCKDINFAGVSAYDCPNGSYEQKKAIFLYLNGLPFVLNDNISSTVSVKILSTFKLTNSTVQNETAGWKTYTNIQHGFGIKYPDQWNKYNESSNSVGFGQNDSYGFNISTVLTNQTIEQYLAEEDKKISQNAPAISVEWTKNITIDSLPAIERGEFANSPGWENTTTYIQKNGIIYVLSKVGRYDGSLADIQTYDKILSTFKFTNSETAQDTTANWKTYTNTQHGYSIEYPANMKLVLAGSADQRWSSSTIDWYASTCVELYASSTWINILTAANVSGVPCGPTGTSATNIKMSDTFNVDGKQITANGFVEPDRSQGFFNFSIGNDMSVVYGIMPGKSLNEQEYQSILYSIHAILSTLKVIPNFTPSSPPDNGRG